MRIDEAQRLWQPETLYLNTASYGLPPTPAWDALQAVLAGSLRDRPDVLVIDSVQTLEHGSFDQPPGSVVQVRECAAALVRHAKQTGTAVVLVGHVTKDGSVAGPKTLEHVVDAVVSLTGERGGALRLLRAAKNRFGSCEEAGVLAMRAGGLEPVADPSSVLLADRRPQTAGSVVFPAMEGTRPLLVELQALVSPNDRVPPRRVAIGIDGRRLALLMGVVANHGKVALGAYDVFVAAAGGVAVREPASDLALCLALCSARAGVALDEGCVAVGEVGLGGEIRRVPGMERRLSEAARMGFRRALVPARTASCDELEIVAVTHLSDALRVARAALRVA